MRADEDRLVRVSQKCLDMLHVVRRKRIFRELAGIRVGEHVRIEAEQSALSDTGESGDYAWQLLQSECSFHCLSLVEVDQGCLQL